MKSDLEFIYNDKITFGNVLNMYKNLICVGISFLNMHDISCSNNMLKLWSDNPYCKDIYWTFPKREKKYENMISDIAGTITDQGHTQDYLNTTNILSQKASSFNMFKQPLDLSIFTSEIPFGYHFDHLTEKVHVALTYREIAGKRIDEDRYHITLKSSLGYINRQMAIKMKDILSGN